MNVLFTIFILYMYVCDYIHIYVSSCVQITLTCVHVKARDQCWLSFSIISTLLLFFETEFLTESGVHGFDWASWKGSLGIHLALSPSAGVTDMCYKAWCYTWWWGSGFRFLGLHNMMLTH